MDGGPRDMAIDLVRLVTNGQPASEQGADPQSLRDQVVEALRMVHDPEIPVNIYDLGLIYGLNIDEATGAVEVHMTLTTPNCPVAESMPAMVTEAVEAVPAVTAVTVELVWEPRWEPSMMSEAAQFALDMYS